ncbi:hypothetical protein HHK36_004767 [Tetracentron sinense]|uniref:Uncharacterized protein n=1 Tax=Tetracentron sinense TaxID=13715 RepID=A0A835DLU8_TETSI|nr:hypothetical protein HHK36_004767 [Tetracentron sinense]
MAVVVKYPYPSTLNVGNFVTMKLTQSNFLLWKTQVLGLIESQEMMGFIDGEYPIPDRQITIPDTEVVDGKNVTVNPAYNLWQRSDRLFRGWITGTLSEEVLGMVFELETASEVWNTLLNSFAQESQEREFFLLEQLQLHRKGTSTISKYIRTFKSVCDDLAAICKLISDRTKVFSLLNGLGSGYESFVTTMLKPPTPTYCEIVPLLQSHETMRNLHHYEGYGTTNHNVAFLGQRPQGQRDNRTFYRRGRSNQVSFNSRGRCFPHTGHVPSHVQRDKFFHPAQNQSGSIDQPNQGNLSGSIDQLNQANQFHQPAKEKGEVCQICMKPNHTALRCWQRFNQTYQSEDIPQALAVMSLFDSQDNAWFPDTGASSHMTTDSGKLQTLIEYHGPEKIMVGNGDKLDITHVGSTLINVGNDQLQLNDVLVVPAIKKNLISVSQLTSDYPYLFEFSSTGFVIKDRGTKSVIASGHRHGDSYALQLEDKKAFFSTRFRVVSSVFWHQRLGHSHNQVIDFLSHNKLISSTTTNKVETVCSSCQMAKSCRLPFILNDEFCAKPFAKIHCTDARTQAPSPPFIGSPPSIDLPQVSQSQSIPAVPHDIENETRMEYVHMEDGSDHAMEPTELANPEPVPTGANSTNQAFSQSDQNRLDGVTELPSSSSIRSDPNRALVGHPMVTRLKDGIVKPNLKHSFTAVEIPWRQGVTDGEKTKGRLFGFGSGGHRMNISRVAMGDKKWRKNNGNDPVGISGDNVLELESEVGARVGDRGTGETYTKRAEKLKGDVSIMFENTVEPLAQLELIDVLQRLGVSYHFEGEIKRTLDTIYTSRNNKWMEDDLYATALHFRLLRQHGYQVPQEVFSSFKDKMGNFKAYLCKDIKGMLSFYEASYLSLQGEVILDEARDFTSSHLNDIKEKIDLNLAKQVSHALELPLHWRMLRLEVRWFVEIYERREDMNPILLELAKLDYNMVQETHQKDLRDMSR